jgi:hypothetical protein
MMPLKGLLGAVVGATLGALIWIAIGYYTGFEVGYIAWGVGLLAGIGMQFAGSERLSPATGALATVAAVLAILIAKYAVVEMVMADALADIPAASEIGADAGIARIADEVVNEFDAAGKTVQWPAEDDDATTEESYPADVWREARTRWEELPADEQATRLEAVRTEYEESLEQLVAGLRKQAFIESFSGFDLLWFGLAAITAYKVGAASGSQTPPTETPSDEQESP